MESSDSEGEPPMEVKGGENLTSVREVHCSDAIQWLKAMDGCFPPGYCGFTSLPDFSELQSIFGVDKFDEYVEWFEDTAALFLSKMPEGSYTIFMQSDIRVIKDNQVQRWIDKSHLCSNAADRTGCTLMWHKLVLLNDNLIRRSTARPTYSHMICYAKRPAPKLSTSYIAAMEDIRVSIEKPLDQLSSSSKSSSPIRISISRKGGKEKAGTDKKAPFPEVENENEHQGTYRTSLFAVPDIFYRGEMVWPKGIGIDCCYVGVAFLKEVAEASCIVDPFAGQGTVLAMANALGVRAVGVELSAKRCRKARNLNMTDKLHLVSNSLRSISLEVVQERKTAHIARGELRHQLQEEEKARLAAAVPQAAPAPSESSVTEDILSIEGGAVDAVVEDDDAIPRDSLANDKEV